MPRKKQVKPPELNKDPVWIVRSFTHPCYVRFHGADLWRYPLPIDFKLRESDFTLVEDIHSATELQCNRLADDLVKALHRLQLPQCFELKFINRQD